MGRGGGRKPKSLLQSQSIQPWLKGSVHPYSPCPMAQLKTLWSFGHFRSPLTWQWRDKPPPSPQGHPEPGTGSATRLGRSGPPASQPRATFPETTRVFPTLPWLSAFRVNGIFAHRAQPARFQGLPAPRPARGSFTTRRGKYSAD